MRVLDLFSGIGGFSLGLERAGMETAAFCEYDKKAQLVLKKHWPNVPLYDDVKTLTGAQLEKDGIENIGLICGGYPCQPFSHAGKRQGEDDDRHLWPEFFRLIQEIRPTWCLCENVAGHISMGLDSVLADLESEGYGVQTFVIPACAVGAYHRRERLWLLAHSESESNNIKSTVSAERLHLGPESQHRVDVWRKYNGACKPFFGDNIDDPIKPIICRGNDGVSRELDRHRLKQLGNSVLPQIPEIIGKSIMESVK